MDIYIYIYIYVSATFKVYLVLCFSRFFVWKVWACKCTSLSLCVIIIDILQAAYVIQNRNIHDTNFNKEIQRFSLWHWRVEAISCGRVLWKYFPVNERSPKPIIKPYLNHWFREIWSASLWEGTLYTETSKYAGF